MSLWINCSVDCKTLIHSFGLIHCRVPGTELLDIGPNLRARPAKFSPGQWVWYYCPRRITGVKVKWAKFYDGPYKILSQVGPVLYRIQRSARSLPKLVYVDKLKLFEGESPKDWEVIAPEEVNTWDVFPGLIELPLDESEGTLQRPKRSHVLPA